MDRRYTYFLNLLRSAFFTTLISLFSALGCAEENLEFLSADEAFRLQSRLLNKDKLELTIKIAPHYLLYRDAFELRTLAGDSINPKITFPPALIKRDEILNKDYEAYANELKLLIAIPLVKTPQKCGFKITYQGCSEQGFCYTPLYKQVLATSTGKITIEDITLEQFKAKPLSPSPSETEQVIEQLNTGTFQMTLLSFLGLGLLLAFTPCILPMVPILANILVGENSRSSRRATLLASLYVLSVAICYAGIGVLAGLMGEQLQVTLQKPIFLIALSLLLTVFALSQFNVIHIQLPSALTQTLHQLQRKQKSGSLVGAIAMGGISALMLSPCVTPALVGALTYIGQTGNAVLGGFALFMMALGMGLPLLMVACVGNRLLPKAGHWMRYTKIITGVLLLVLSASLIARAFPQWFYQTSTKTPSSFIQIQSAQDLKRALKDARVLKKPVILDVHADWCISCRELEKDIFNDPSIKTLLKKTTLLRLDITQQTSQNEALQKMLHIVGPPTLLFFNVTGEELKGSRLIGRIGSENFLEHLQAFLSQPEK